MTVDLRNEAACDRDERRAAVRVHPTLNGIDFVEYFEQLAPPPATFWLIVTFLKNAPALVGQTGKFTVTGGTRIVGVEVVDVKAVAGHPEQLEVDLSEAGDFSTYMLAIDDPGLDVQLSSIEFHFRPGCPTPFDCRPVDDCPPDLLDEPVIDYLAKDYASFRRLLLDLAAQRNPGWQERNPADVGVMLVELLAYFGDRLSYFQDAVATEAFLDTCRRRVSAKRHVRLIDYHMHDGRNAWTHVHLHTGGAGTVPRGTRLMTRIAQPLRGKTSPPATLIPAIELDFDGDPVLRGVTVFETTAQMDIDPINNLLTIHAWSDEECCLPSGTTSVSLYAVSAGFAVRPHLQPGDFLLFEEVKGRETGAAPDADPARRQVVRLTEVVDAQDPVYTDAFAPDGTLQPAGVGDPVLLLQHVSWSKADALRLPLCLSARYPETGLITGISVARGNVVPCDHGRTVVEDVSFDSSSPGSVMLPRAPLTFQSSAPVVTGSPYLDADRFDLTTPVDQAEPAVELELSLSSGDTEVWLPVPDLLDDNAFATHFVVDVGDAGDATLRFGDDEYGQHPDNVVQISARYRVGNGLAGNVGSGSLVHVSAPSPAVVLPAIDSVWQAIVASGGVAPQTIEEVRQLAPAAFRAEQFRAVTEGDYEAAALKVAGVEAAKCVFRWTGSWRTVFVAIHPTDPADLITLPTGENELRSDLADAVDVKLRRYKLAGYDLEIRAARYVPLLIEMRICVAHGYFRGDVLLSVTRVMSNRRYADGTVGFFHPTRFHFGQSVYLSRIYEAVQGVTGVDSVEVTTFQRYWSVADGELASGEIALADDEIARLDNDRNFPENGVLHLSRGGRFMMSAHPPGTCHCCGSQPDDGIFNRPGLSALAYRIGTFASFRKAMLQSIARDPGLARLTTRQSDDFSITLMELWAAVGDVLTFYQERIANEAFLRTATQRDSVLRLARMLDYRLRAGLAAEVPVVFTADDGKSVRIPLGLRMMSVPEQDQVPQLFETIEAIVASAKLNELRVFPLPVAVNPFARGMTSAVVLSGPEKLAASDKLLFFDRRGLEEKAVTKVETVDEALVATWSPSVQSASFDMRATAAARTTRTLRCFGLNAPSTAYTLDTVPNPPVWKSTPVGGFGVNGPDVPLDARYDDLHAGARLLLRTAEPGKPPIQTAVVVAKAESTETIGILSDTVTRVTMRRVLRAEAPAVPVSGPQRIFARGLEGACLQYVGTTWNLIDQLPGDDVTSALAAVGRGAVFELFARGRGGSLLHRQANGFAWPAAAWEDLGGVISSAPAVASWGAMRLDVFARGMDGALWHKWFDGAWHNWESLGGQLTSAPAAISWGPNRIDVVARGTDNALWHYWWDGASWHGWTPLGGDDTVGTPALASTAANRLDIFARTADGGLRHLAWNGTQWLPWDTLDAAIASDPGAAAVFGATTIAVYAVGPDGTLMRAAWNGTTLDTWKSQDGGFDVITDRRGVTLHQLDPGDVEFRQFTYGRRITGGSVAVPLAKLDAIDKRRVIELSDGTAAAAHRATVAGSASFAAIPLGDADHLRIDFTPDLPAPLDAGTAILRGNVAEATQGETVRDEILGDGDATVPFQKFALRKKPLTYVATAESLLGQSSLQVLINGELWTEVPTLFAQPANARVYATRQLDDGTTIVQFGDGVTGARVPSGRGNVVATYRIGVGVAALIAEQLSILLDQPPGLKSALNRVAAEGGADAETLDNARAAAPTTVKTFGRAVSLLDFELITTGTAGVAKSNATWVWSGLEKAIYLTVAGAKGTAFSVDGLERIRLALGTVRDTGHPLTLGNFVPVPVVLTINVAVDATHVRDTVAGAVRAALRDYFAFANLAFAQPIHLSVISALVQGVTGVLSVDIDTLHFKGFQSWTAAQLGIRGATADPAQMHLRIFAARPRMTGPAVDPIVAAAFGANVPEVIPAEQAVIQSEASDLSINTTGGIV